MDPNQLQELATNARLDHWPPHLGVRTDAEKIEYLAQRLEEAADAEKRADELADELETTQEEHAGDEIERDELKAEVERLKSDVKKLESKLSEIREIVA